MLGFLATPTTTEDFLTYIRDKPAMNEAINIMNSLGGLARSAMPLAILAIARNRHPEQSLSEAATRLLLDVRQAKTYFEAHADQCKAIDAADRDRMAPMMTSATRQMFDLAASLPLVDAEARSAFTAREKLRNSLIEAKAAPEDIDRLAPALDPIDLAAKAQGIKAEIAALENFLRTMDERYLPEGFVVTVLSNPHSFSFQY